MPELNVGTLGLKKNPVIRFKNVGSIDLNKMPGN